MNKLNIFKESDFFLLPCFSVKNRQLDGAESAKRCNEILNEYIEKNGVKVSGSRFDGIWEVDEMIVGQHKPSDTHTAILINIEPIKKKCTEHIPDVNKTTVLGGYSECSNCGVKLKSEWKEAE